MNIEIALHTPKEILAIAAISMTSIAAETHLGCVVEVGKIMLMNFRPN